MTRRGWALFVAMSLIWGLPYLLIKVAVEEVSPTVVVFVRCVLAAALLLPWTIARGQLLPALRQWRWLLVFTVLEMTGPWLLIAWAEQTLTSSLVGLLIAGVPLVAVVTARLTGDADRLTRTRLAGLALGVAGIVALLGLDIAGAQLLAIGAVVLTIIGYATAPMVVNRQLADVSGVAASAVALTLTAVVYAPFALPQAGQVAQSSPRALSALATLGLLCTALALVLFFALIRETGPQRALVITFVNPAVAVLLGVLVLDEPLTLGLAVGLPVILVGCVLATGRSRAPVVDVVPA